MLKKNIKLVLNKGWRNKMNKNNNLTFGQWWKCEENVLISMLEDKKPLHYIADVLTRDYHGVRKKIEVLLRNGQLNESLLKKPRK